MALVRSYVDIAHTCMPDPGMGRFRLAYFVSGIVYKLAEAGFRMMHPNWACLLLAMIVVPPAASTRTAEVQRARGAAKARRWATDPSRRFGLGEQAGSRQ